MPFIVKLHFQTELPSHFEQQITYNSIISVKLFLSLIFLDMAINFPVITQYILKNKVDKAFLNMPLSLQLISL